MKVRLWLFILLLLAVIPFATLFHTAARPLNFITVSTTADTTANDGLCSLREAVQAANTDTPSGGAAGECNAGDGADFINLPSGTYPLSGRGDDTNETGDLDILSDISIDGTSGVTITISCSGCESDRLLDVHSGASLAIYDVTLANGRAPGGFAIFGTPPPPGASGGAIRSAGSLIVARTILVGNLAGDGHYSQGGQFPPSNGGDGGAIAITSGIFSISDSHFESNRAGGGNAIDPDETTDGGDGGAIYQASGTSGTVVRTLFVNNDGGNAIPYSTEPAPVGGSGGAIFSAGIMSVGDSAFTLNSSGYGDPSGDGGAVAISNTGNLTLYASTFSDNTTGFGTPGVGRGGALFLENGGMATITHSTIAYNRTPGTLSVGGGGGGIYSVAPVNALTLSNSIIANNQVSPAVQGDDCFGAVTSAGYLFLEDTQGCVVSGGVGNRFGQDPALLALADNGGNTLTHALAANSPALDIGNCTTTIDQRGEPRPNDIPSIPNATNGCDMGAFEAKGLLPTVTPTGTNTPIPTRTPSPTPGTPTVTPTSTTGPSPTPTSSPTPTATVTPPLSPSPTGTVSGPPTLTVTVPVTRTPPGPPTLTSTPAPLDALYLPLVQR